MTKDLGTSGTPAAARSLRTPWRDPRLWTGVALVAASIAVGARVMAGADDLTPVWAARSDLQPGVTIRSSDVVATSVHLDDRAARRYLRADRPLPHDRRVLRAVAEGELVPAAALGAEAAGVVSVPVSVPAGAVPPSLVPGAVVDVWVASGDRGEAASPVLDDVVVLEVPAPDELLGAGSDREVVVGVPATARDGVGRVLAAARDGRVSITREG
ncbi:hypothetical protein [Nocardioides jiangxiensis]|uniref:SAF domain-containing protein n=1 Tax=Nocardioides jiangxiensis TaxID=3064524 RepID=A0ABT9B291_9ACTN|nr:hypothetical protein [Nocardioides sp. WY-20]MDO7868944.1 hypothetical protein [Nocardioides sp. WY-20]